MKAGDRIRLVSMGTNADPDPNPIEPGALGTVERVQSFGNLQQIYMQWDDGRTLSLVIPPDVAEVVS